MYGENGIEAQVRSMYLAMFGNGKDEPGMLQMFQELRDYMKAYILLGKLTKYIVYIIVSILGAILAWRQLHQ